MGLNLIQQQRQQFLRAGSWLGRWLGQLLHQQRVGCLDVGVHVRRHSHGVMLLGGNHVLLVSRMHAHVVVMHCLVVMVHHFLRMWHDVAVRVHHLWLLDPHGGRIHRVVLLQLLMLVLVQLHLLLLLLLDLLVVDIGSTSYARMMTSSRVSMCVHVVSARNTRVGMMVVMVMMSWCLPPAGDGCILGRHVEVEILLIGSRSWSSVRDSDLVSYRHLCGRCSLLPAGFGKHVIEQRAGIVALLVA